MSLPIDEKEFSHQRATCFNHLNHVAAKGLSPTGVMRECRMRPPSTALGRLGWTTRSMYG